MTFRPARHLSNPDYAARLELVEAARQTFVTRRRRAQLFDKSIIREYAWDMLLALYMFQLDGPRFTVARLLEFAAVRQTTALRWVDYLEEQGLVARESHPTDGRATLVDLTEKGRAVLDAYFSETLRPES